MLILVAVTVTVAKDGGLFETARTAKTGTQKEADRENLVAAAVGAYDARSQEVKEEELKQNLGNEWNVKNQINYYKVTSPNGNEFKVNIKNATVEDNIGETGGNEAFSKPQITVNAEEEIPNGSYFVANPKEVQDETTGEINILGDVYAKSEDEFKKCSMEDNDVKLTYKGTKMQKSVGADDYFVDANNKIIYNSATDDNDVVIGWQMDGGDSTESVINNVFIKIGDYLLKDMCEAFRENKVIKDASKMILPNTITYIDWCFKNCTNLEKAPNLPTSITAIDKCFSGCTALKEVTYLGTIEQFKQIDGYATCGDSGLVIHCTDGDYTVQ
mgnify:CR=1 FL=1